MRWAIVLVLGTGLGLLAALGDASNGTAGQTQAAQAIDVATHLGTTYAAAAVIAGALLGQRTGAILAGPLVLVTAILSFTGYVTHYVDHARLTVDSLAAVSSIYLVAAVTIGPFLAMVGQLTRTRGPLATLARVSVPAALVVEVAVRYPLSRSLYVADPARAWTLTAVIGIGVLGFVAAGLGHQTARRH